MQIAEQLRSEYLKWLADRTRALEHGEAGILSTPFLNSFNDGIEIFVEKRGAEFLLHDGARTIEDLMTTGVKIEDSERRKKLIRSALAGFGAEIIDGKIQLTANISNLPIRLHFLLSAILRLNDLWMSVVPKTWSDFYEMVKEFLDQNNVIYVPNVIIAGRSVEHEIDFIVTDTKRQERLVKILGNPTLQAAKAIAFTWFDIKETRAGAERVVLVNDLIMPDPFEADYSEQQRRLSEQTIAILQAYSNKVYRWSNKESAISFFQGRDNGPVKKIVSQFLSDQSRFKFSGVPCGCLTWKHELQKKDCREMWEQELGEMIESLVWVGSIEYSWNAMWNKDWSIERDWLCGKPMGQGG